MSEVCHRRSSSSMARTRIALRLVGCLGVALLAGCALTGAGEASPVSRYALVGCTYYNPNDATPVGCAFGTGGGNKVWHTTTSYLQLGEDGSFVEHMSSTFTYSPTQPLPGDPIESSPTFTGVWTTAANKVVVTWPGLLTPTTLERLHDDTLRTNEIYNSAVYFWFVRVP